MMIESSQRNSDSFLAAEDAGFFNHVKENATRGLQNAMIHASFADNQTAKDLAYHFQDRRKSGDSKDDAPEVTWNTKRYSSLIEDNSNNLTIEWKLKNPYSTSSSSPIKYGNYLFPETTVADHRFHYDDLLKESPTAERNLFDSIRESLASYQEGLGTPRSEYTFAALIRTMAQATGRSLLALVYVIINIAPVVEIFLYIFRFILDKAIDIRSTKDVRQTIVKCAIFSIQLLGIYVCVTFIFGFIVLPLVYMTVSILGKILLFD